MKLEDLFSKEPKKYLFISFSFNKREKENYIKKYLPTADFVEWKDISFHCNDILIKQINIKEYSAIVIGLVANNERKFSVIKEYVEQTKIKYLQYGNFTQNKNKLIQTYKFAINNIAQPKTIIGNTSELNAKNIVKNLSTPVISKIIDGSQGDGIEKHDTLSALTTFLNKFSYLCKS